MTRHVLDNRGLIPPEPMVRILAAIAKLDAEDELCALMDREPFPLYSELTRRGFTWEFTEEDGEQRLIIRRDAQ